MKHIDNLFKEKLYNHEASVPEGMWEKIAPIAEEESGRALLWFWFAGALTLILGGYGIYKMMNSTSTDDPNTLAFEEQMITPEETSISNTLVSLSNEVEQEEVAEELVTPVAPVATKQVAPKKTKAYKKKDLAKIGEQRSGVSNTVETIPNVSGVPANLVITKKYINKEGSVIKQSNLSQNLDKDAPVYDVIINSEAKDVNAGALLRIVEPLENIPLPTLSKQLKKKNKVAIF